MSDDQARPGDSPARPARAHRTIVLYSAECRGCKYHTMSPREAHVHAVSQGHVLAETRHHLLEPPE